MSSRLPHFSALDGLRGIVILTMLVYHGDFSWLGGGYRSVSTFFTLSGFLITSLLLIERETRGRIDLGEFWERRLRRLMPAALAGIALVAVYARFVGDTEPDHSASVGCEAALLYAANFRLQERDQ